METEDQRYATYAHDETDYYYNVHSAASEDGGSHPYYNPHDNVPLDPASTVSTESIPFEAMAAYHPPPHNFMFPPTPSATTLYTDSNVVARGMRSPRRSPETPRRLSSQVEDQLCIDIYLSLPYFFVFLDVFDFFAVVVLLFTAHPISCADMPTPEFSAFELVDSWCDLEDDNTLTVYDDALVNVEQILQELVKRNEAINGPRKSRKRKVSNDNEGSSELLSDEAKEQFKAYLLSQMQDQSNSSDSGSSNADSPEDDVDDPNTALALTDNFQVADPPVLKSPIDFRTNGPLQTYDGITEFTTCLPHFPPEILEEIQMPLRGFSPTTRVIAPARAPSLKKAGDHYLLQAYLAVTAPRLQYTSPSYINLWSKYIPSMAQESPALMEAMLAFAALQVGLRDNDQRYLMVEAPTHYHRALMAHGQALGAQESMTSYAPLATAILMGMFELWSGENMKMGVHMLGARDMILARGKEAHMTPVGRALYAVFRRLDIGTSSVTGNPCFLTPDWWVIDPMARLPIDKDGPTLFIADAALSKSTIINSRLTYVKSWAIRKRRDLWVQSKGNDTDPVFLEKKIRLQESICRKIARLEKMMDDLEDELPDWFGPSEDNVWTGKDGEDEDINQTDIHVIIPRKYSHFSVALADAWYYCLRLQTYRVKYPDVPVADPKIGAYVHGVLRIFASLGFESTAFMMPILFFAGMELRQKPHQDWLAGEMQKHIEHTGFPGFVFVLAGCRFAWMKLQGQFTGRFTKIKEGAAARIDGVSENLWNAEGVLGTMEALSLYDSPDMARQRKNFQGDLETSNVIGEDIEEEEVNVKEPSLTPQPMPESASSPLSRNTSEANGHPNKRARYDSFAAERNQKYLRDSPGLEQTLTEELD
ncbi:hypothetical protein H072_1393 [Dactylellina haptotyla CBS 200.50]|uniref:Transcription factor domain-containing protein n=1 Tax=Dactylellina haptotyla (strain CBS 200.50) TaxID=1284197 RepID=S8AP23_DACHA|nr:hypothetical protein H072_1393 [Dactylellina haptotyla CBS 200.50]